MHGVKAHIHKSNEIKYDSLKKWKWNELYVSRSPHRAPASRPQLLTSHNKSCKRRFFMFRVLHLFFCHFVIFPMRVFVLSSSSHSIYTWRTWNMCGNTLGFYEIKNRIKLTLSLHTRSRIHIHITIHPFERNDPRSFMLCVCWYFSPFPCRCCDSVGARWNRLIAPANEIINGRRRMNSRDPIAMSSVLTRSVCLSKWLSCDAQRAILDRKKIDRNTSNHEAIGKKILMADHTNHTEKTKKTSAYQRPRKQPNQSWSQTSAMLMDF